MFWRQKRTPESLAHRLSEQMQSDRRFAESNEFFSGIFGKFVSCQDGFVRDGMKEEFDSVKEAGLVFALAGGSLSMVRAPADIPDLLEKLGSAAAALITACDKLTSCYEEYSSFEDVRIMMEGITQAAGHTVVTAEKEYRYQG